MKKIAGALLIGLGSLLGLSGVVGWFYLGFASPFQGVDRLGRPMNPDLYMDVGSTIYTIGSSLTGVLSALPLGLTALGVGTFFWGKGLMSRNID